MGKHAAGIGIIGGSDGPTSIFMAGKRRFSLRLMRRRRLIARIRRRVKPEPHTVEELIAYIEKKYGARRLAEDSISFKEQYRCARAALVMQERPELLKLPVPEFPSVERKNPDRKALEDYFARVEARQKEAEAIPDSEVPMDFAIYRIVLKEKGKAGGSLEVTTEKLRQTAGVSFSYRNKKQGERAKAISRDIYRYFGFSAQDAQEGSVRFLSFVTALYDL